MRKIVVIGGGIVGITTAIALKLAGSEVEIITEDRADCSHSKSPTFASLYPAASVIPHSVAMENGSRVIEDSQKIFRKFLTFPQTGVRVQKHYEVYESEVTPLPYVQKMKNLEFLPKNGCGGPDVPSLGDNVYGWSFDCIFVEYPIYIKTLYDIFKKCGGVVTIKKIASLSEIPCDIIVNCTGAGAMNLVDDSDGFYLRGHVVLAEIPDLFKNKYSGELFSYNYTPSPLLYRTSSGDAADIYCYPRSVGWVLGGSRQKGTVHDGKWYGEETIGDTINIQGVEVPEPIITLNRRILQRLINIDISKFPLSARIGYRFSRNKGVHLELQDYATKKVVHNYGHGGAGVALSWGSAVHVLRLLMDNGYRFSPYEAHKKEPLITEISNTISELCF